MIHHISIAANDPLQVAEVLAELFQGQAIPFPNHEGSFIALPFDSQGTLIEVHPQGTELMPGLEQNEAARASSNPHASAYSAFHAALSVPVSEAQIMAIAAREGWRAVHCDRAGFFEVIEFWLENQQLIELLPPALAAQYLNFTQPQTLKPILKTLRMS